MADKDHWDEWVERYINTNDPIPVFEASGNRVVQTKEHGLNNRPILKRSPQMDDAIRKEGMKVIGDWNTTDDTYDGLLYLMYHLQDGEVVPLYVGKAGKYGRDGERLSANIRDVRGESTNKFARWGDGYDYHIGDLSAAALGHERDPVPKYRRWADALFEPEGRRLRRPVYFWVRAWRDDDSGVYYPEPALGRMEYELIGVASDFYPDHLLNKEGT